MSLSDHPKAYGSAAVALAFAAGIIVTLGFKDLYPDLELRYERRREQVSSFVESRRGSTLAAPVTLEDHTKRQSQLPVPAAIPSGIEGTIGNTPIFEIRSLSKATGCSILAKAEFLNGAGNSPKDRVALQMIIAAEEAGLLTPHNGDTIYEGTSGSTGISLAALARARGYRAHICLDTDQSMDKVNLLHHLGATVERVPPAPITSTNHYVNRARTRAAEHATTMADGSKGFFADQFENSANWAAHYHGTGPEILTQTGADELVAFVSGAGTGGTISGVACYLKEDMGLAGVRIVLADPQGSGLYNKVKYGVMYSEEEKEGTRRRTQVDTIVEGIGINRLTENFDKGRELIDDAVKVTDVQAARMARWLVERDGIFAGSSSAVNCVAAVVTALKLKKEGKNGSVVTLLCDSGARHLSKFWKTVGDMGLEHEHEGIGLLEVLGLNDDGT